MAEEKSRRQNRRTRSDGLSYSTATIAVCLGSLILLEMAAMLAQEDPLVQWYGRGEFVPGRQLAASGSGCFQLTVNTSLNSSNTSAHGSSSSSTQGSAGGHVGEHVSGAFAPVIFFLIAYLSSAMAQQITQLLPPRIRVPHSVNLFVMGAVLAALARNVEDTEFGTSIKQFSHIDPHVIFWILLPALLYEDASSVHWHVFERVTPNALILAVPGVIVNTLLTGTIIKVVFSTIEWSWSSAFLLGSILSATDPVAVIGALHSLSAPDKLSSLISGESLFNDGSAVVLFHLFWDLARNIREFDFGYTVLFFSRMALGGPALALVVSFVVWVWLRFTVRFQIEILLIIVSIYGLFFVAEHEVVKVSGVLAVVCFGFFMASTGHYALDIDKEYEHHAIMNFLGLLSNEAIFLIAGLVSFRLGFDNSNIKLEDYLELLFLYVVIHATRATVIALFFPLLRNSGYGLTMKEAVICVYGGLRGAVGIAMALLVEHDKSLDDAVRDRIAFHTSGIVFGTLLINGTTITTVYKNLQVYSKAAHHEQLLQLALRKADGVIQRHAKMLKEHWFFHNCQLDLVMKIVPKLSESSEHHTHMDVGHHVYEVMDALAERLGKLNPEEHLVKKLTASWKRTDAHVPNPFLIGRGLGHTDAMAEDHEDELELAMQLVDDGAFSTPEETPTSNWVPLASLRNWEPSPSCQTNSAAIDATTVSSVTKSRSQGTVDLTPPVSGPTSRQPSQGGKDSTDNGKLDEGNPEVEPGMEPTSLLDPEMIRMRARGRWKRVFMKMRMAIAIMRQVRKKDSATPPGFDRIASRTSSSYSKALERFVRDDEASMVEIHQLVINAGKATLKSMIEARSLSADSFSIILQALNVQEEFISTEGTPTEPKKKTSTHSRTSKVSNGSLTQADHYLSRLSHSFSAAWGSIRSTLFRPSSILFWLASKLVRIDHWLEACWCLHKRDIEVVAAYIFTQEHLLEDLEILEDFKNEIREPMKGVTQQAKKEALRGFVHQPYDCGMFMLFEHILLARLIMRAQFHLLEHLAHDGIVVEEDVEHLCKHTLAPTEYALTKYVPSVEQLRTLGSPKVDEYHANSLKRFLMKFIIELEFHEEDVD